MKWQVFILFLVVPSFLLNLFAAPPLKKPLQKPKLLVVIVIDQMRSDYLTRFEKRFLPARRQPGTVGGFNYLMSYGAYFPVAEYDILQAMTCPGHAMISTGAYPMMNEIVMNDWFDKKRGKNIYCAEDEEHGLSPKNLRTSTFPDELKIAGYKSQVVGVSLKDRSAIMLAGHQGDHVYWIDEKNLAWTTSSFYSKNPLPTWVQTQNTKLNGLIGKDGVWESNEKATGLTEDSQGPFKKTFKYGEKNSLSYPFGIDITFDLAAAAVKELKLGKKDSPDVLNISLSSHDILGHEHGPNSREMEEMTVHEDRALSKFLNFLKSEGLLDSSLIVLTADHGVAPTVDFMTKNKMDAGRLSYSTLIKNIHAHFDKKWGSPRNKKWIASQLTFNLYFDRETLAEKNLNLKDVESEAAKILLQDPGIWFVLKSTDYDSGFRVGPDLQGPTMRQFSPTKSGDVVIIPRPFYMHEGRSGTTHLTGFSYDKSVPLIFLGKGIKAGIYPQQAKVVDIAPTLSFIYGVLPPATSAGKILEIFE